MVQEAPERSILPDPHPYPSPQGGGEPALATETKRAAPGGGSFVAMIVPAQYTPPAWAAAPASGGTVAGGPDGAAT